MATSVVTPVSRLVKQVESLLNPYEELTVQQDVPGVMGGFMVTLVTNTYVHLKHTPKTTFIPHELYQAASMAVLPNRGFMETWLEKAREAATQLINKGDYIDQKLVSGEWQAWHRKFNQWVYYDRKNQVIFGKVKTLPNLTKKVSVRDEGY